MKEKLHNLLRQINKKIPEDTSANLLTGDILDSLDIIRIVAEMEKGFDVVIQPKDIVPKNFESVDAIFKLLNSHVDNKL